MAETPRGVLQDGTDMPHSVAGTPPNERVPEVEQGAERYLTEYARHSKIDGIRGLMALEKPGLVSLVTYPIPYPTLHKALCAGRPNPETYPFESMTLTLRAPLEERIAIQSKTAANGHTNGITPSESRGVQVVIDGEDLDIALQYGPSAGLGKLRHLMEDLQSQIHHRETKQGGDGWAVSFGSGTQDLMYKTFQVVLEDGDPVLCETPLYAGVLPALRAKNAECIEVEIDDGGLSAENLERILKEWPEGKKRPRCVYTNPIGCNPSGCSASRERKLQILQICKRYDILIIEDDPYYFLTTPLIPSYFELEPLITPNPSRVIRFDSFSKLFSGGMRLGYATGPAPIVTALDVVTSATNLHTSSISQIVAYKLLQHWGLEGFMSHSRAVAHFYAGRRHRFEAMAHKHLDGLASWVSPVAGMFLWIDTKESGIEDTQKLIMEEALAKGVLAVPGFAFYPSGRKSSHLRVSFSIIEQDEAELGLSRLAEAIREAREAIAAAK